MGDLDSFSIVVPTYRRPEALRATLAALAALDYPSTRYEVVVVDDDDDRSGESTVRSFAQSGRLDLRYVAQANSGAATARNRGARDAEGDLLLFCDDDILLEPDNLHRQLAARAAFDDPLVNGSLAFSEEAVGVLRTTPFGRYRLALDQGFQSEADGEPLGEDRYATRLLTACNLSVRRDVFWALGGFDEAFPYAGAEDQALSLAAAREGLPLVRDHAMRVRHNDQILSFAQFCRREERSAATFVVLVERFPEEASRPLFAQNAPASPGDGRRLRAKKLAKLVLSAAPILAAARAAVQLAERVPLPDGLRRAGYRAVLGLHINRGVRAALSRKP